MSVTVVDASAIAAVLFNEPESAPVVASVRERMLAPTLLKYEIASVCAAKLAREPARADLTIARYRLLAHLDIEFTEAQWDLLPQLANRWRLSAYDAAYLQLALDRNAPLVTLDAGLAAAFDQATGRRK